MTEGVSGKPPTDRENVGYVSGGSITGSANSYMTHAYRLTGRGST